MQWMEKFLAESLLAHPLRSASAALKARFFYATRIAATRFNRDVSSRQSSKRRAMKRSNHYSPAAVTPGGYAGCKR